MVAVKLEHSDLAEHQGTIFKRLQAFRKEGQLCDVVLKSCEGKEHRAHTAVLCAASEDFKNMLVGPFVEANQVQQGQPVEMAATDAVVSALLKFIYGEEPQVDLEDSLELLRLADAYDFPQLAAAIEAGLRISLDSAPVATVLKVLLQTQHLHDLKAACEKKVAAHFEMCVELADFLELSAGQLGRILGRPDLKVTREEVVVQGLFKWFKKSKDGGAFAALLQNIDFQSLSSKNLASLAHLSASMGRIGHDLQQEVGEALRCHKKRSAGETPKAFRPKRRCLQNWSPELGASSQAPQKVLPFTSSMCWHNGAIYYAKFAPSGSTIFRWKPGDAQSQAVAGNGARVNGENFFGWPCKVSVSREGNIFVVDIIGERLLSFENGSGNVLLSDVDMKNAACSPNGDVYVLTQGGGTLEKLIGATRQPVISSEQLPAELQFHAFHLFVTKDDVIYMSDPYSCRVLRLNPGDAEPVVVGQAPNKERSWLLGLFVMEDDKIYVVDKGNRRVWTFHPGDAAWTEVLTCPEGLDPFTLLVEGRSLYLSLGRVGDGDPEGVYEYLLPPDLQLERYRSTDLAGEKKIRIIRG